MSELELRAARYAALGEPLRLRIVDELGVSDRSPAELAELLHIRSNLLAHHLDVLEGVGLIGATRPRPTVGAATFTSLPAARALASNAAAPAPRDVLFLCSANSSSARSWRPRRVDGAHGPSRVLRRYAPSAARTVVPWPRPGGQGSRWPTPHPQRWAPSRPAPRWSRSATASTRSFPSRRHGGTGRRLDPVADGSAAAFDRTVAALDARIHRFATFPTEQETRA